MRCPFHQDSSASGSVNTETGKYKCFACDFAGDGIDVIKWQENLTDFNSAVQFAEEVVGTVRADVPGTTGGRQRRRFLSAEQGPKQGQRSIFSAGSRKKPHLGAGA